MRTGREPSESFPSALARPFPAGLAVFLLAVPRPFRTEAHPPSSFPAPSAFTFDRLPVVPFRALAFRPPPGRPASAFPGVSSLFAVVNRQQLWRGFPCLTPRFFPGLPRLQPALSSHPPPAFRTPSTVCSATDPASLFHLAATFRVSPSGVYPSLRIHSGFLRTFPLLSLGNRACGCNRASPLAVDFRGLLPAASAVTCVLGENMPAPRPSWSSLSSGLSVSFPGIPLRDASVYDLLRDEPTAPDP